jgi:hypothetical protein
MVVLYTRDYTGGKDIRAEIECHHEELGKSAAKRRMMMIKVTKMSRKVVILS